jgi:putative phage-type endonuclease
MDRTEWASCQTEAAWLEFRGRGVGASEAAALMGVSPWSTPLELYLRKRGELPPLEAPRLRWGKKLEPLVAEEYSAAVPGALLVKPPAVCWRTSTPWTLASLDYWVPFQRVVEIKTVSRWADWGEDGSDEVPPYYALQVQQQMYCAGVERADVAALCLNSWRLRVFHVERNPDTCAMLVEAERDFMRRVEAQDPPEPDWEHPTTVDLLSSLEPVGDVAVLDSSAEVLVEQYEELGEEIKRAEAVRKEAKARLIFALGGAAEGDLPSGRVVRRKKIERRGYVVEPSSYYQFSIGKAR